VTASVQCCWSDCCSLLSPLAFKITSLLAGSATCLGQSFILFRFVLGTFNSHFWKKHQTEDDVNMNFLAHRVLYILNMWFSKDSRWNKHGFSPLFTEPNCESSINLCLWEYTVHGEPKRAPIHNVRLLVQRWRNYTCTLNQTRHHVIVHHA